MLPSSCFPTLVSVCPSVSCPLRTPCSLSSRLCPRPLALPPAPDWTLTFPCSAPLCLTCDLASLPGVLGLAHGTPLLAFSVWDPVSFCLCFWVVSQLGDWSITVGRSLQRLPELGQSWSGCLCPIRRRPGGWVCWEGGGTLNSPKAGIAQPHISHPGLNYHLEGTRLPSLGWLGSSPSPPQGFSPSDPTAQLPSEARAYV